MCRDLSSILSQVDHTYKGKLETIKILPFIYISHILLFIVCDIEHDYNGKKKENLFPFLLSYHNALYACMFVMDSNTFLSPSYFLNLIQCIF